MSRAVAPKQWLPSFRDRCLLRLSLLLRPESAPTTMLPPPILEVGRRGEHINYTPNLNHRRWLAGWRVVAKRRLRARQRVSYGHSRRLDGQPRRKVSLFWQKRDFFFSSRSSKRGEPRQENFLEERRVSFRRCSVPFARARPASPVYFRQPPPPRLGC